MIQNIFIIGASGNVGRELIKQITEKDGYGLNVNPSRIVGLSDSKKYIFCSTGIQDDILKKCMPSQSSARNILDEEGKMFEHCSDFLDIVKAEGMEGEIVFADVTSGKDDLLVFHKQVLNQSKNFLVTANKNPISLYSIEDFDLLNKEYGRYDTNTTVMGGAGILNFIKIRSSLHDTIHKIEGVFSGTLGYILSELEKQEKTFSQIVRDAKEGGYTEPNPWDDLNGLDVARKLVILARYAGHKVAISDVKVVPLIDEKYGNAGENFLQDIQAEDSYFDQIVQEAKKEQKVLRYVGEMTFQDDVLTLEVGLKSVDKDSELGNLSGTSNLALVETSILSHPLPHVIKSRGAGLGVTAGAVRVGIAKMLPVGMMRF